MPPTMPDSIPPPVPTSPSQRNASYEPLGDSLFQLGSHGPTRLKSSTTPSPNFPLPTLKPPPSCKPSPHGTPKHPPSSSHDPLLLFWTRFSASSSPTQSFLPSTKQASTSASTSPSRTAGGTRHSNPRETPSTACGLLVSPSWTPYSRTKTIRARAYG